MAKTPTIDPEILAQAAPEKDVITKAAQQPERSPATEATFAFIDSVHISAPVLTKHSDLAEKLQLKMAEFVAGKQAQLPPH